MLAHVHHGVPVHAEYHQLLQLRLRKQRVGPDTGKRLLMDTPEGGWDAYYADKKLSESEKKKPARGAGSSCLTCISDDAPVSPLAKQPKFDE